MGEVDIEVVDYDCKGYWESRVWADNASITPISGWRGHAVLLSIAAVLGAFSATSGLRNSKSSRLAKRIPDVFPEKYHRYISAVYYLLLFSVLVFWATVTMNTRGSLFYSAHGRLALATVIFFAAGILTTIPLLRGFDRVRTIHWSLNMTAYVLFLITILLGILRAL